jgi:hypothetical protein
MGYNDTSFSYSIFTKKTFIIPKQKQKLLKKAANIVASAGIVIAYSIAGR